MPSVAPLTYSARARFNHWAVAIAMIAMLIVGWTLALDLLSDAAARGVRDLHKAFGVLILAFGLWRVISRLREGFPPPAAEGPRWQEVAARWMHYALLAAIVIMPLSGLTASMFAGRDIDMFGLFVIPAIGEVVAIRNAAGATHYFGGIATTLLTLLHIGAALKHHVVDRDATLLRMTRGAATPRA